MGVGRGGGKKNECQHRKEQGLNQADEKFHNIKWERIRYEQEITTKRTSPAKYYQTAGS